MPESTFKFDEDGAKATERAYRTPEITQQRMATLKALALRSGESALDIGVGPGFLAQDMAQLVGDPGQVVGIDNAPAMIEIARDRCIDFNQVEIKLGDAENLEFNDCSFDAVVCAQVLLYVAEIRHALSEIHRVLKPGGRAVIIETDWRGLVLSSSFSDVTEKMIQSWDAEVASPNLPPLLPSMLSDVGFSAVSVSAVPVVVSSCIAGNYAHGMIHQFSSYAVKQGRVSKSDARNWIEDLYEKHQNDAFFFCINRFLFTAVRV